MKKKSAQTKKVLGDYKKEGSKFIPPMTHMLGRMKEASYARQTLPELIWWDVLADQVSAQFAIDVAGEIGKHLKDRKEKQCWWAFITDYKNLSDDDFVKLKAALGAKGMLKYLQGGLENFLQLYPECPLWCFMPGKPAGAVDLKYLSRFENRLDELGNKRSRNGVLMQAQAVYMGFVLGRLKVFKGLALADFPEVSKYPDTPRSLEGV